MGRFDFLLALCDNRIDGLRCTPGSLLTSRKAYVRAYRLGRSTVD